jgi:hypothetical protein
MQKQRSKEDERPSSVLRHLTFEDICPIWASKLRTFSLVIGVGFAYMGYTSGHYSKAYELCKDDILSHARMGTYQSVDESAAALRSCDGVTG